MKKITASDFFWFLVRIWIGVIFTYAGLTKLLEPAENFRGVLVQYGFLSYEWCDILARIIPWGECLTGVFLATGYLTRKAALASSFFTLGFIGAMLFYFYHHHEFPTDCGCFGAGSIIHLTGGQVLFMDSLHLILALCLFKKKDHALSLDGIF